MQGSYYQEAMGMKILKMQTLSGSKGAQSLQPDQYLRSLHRRIVT